MAAPRFSGVYSGRRGPSVIECALLLSVIFGLMFVAMRIKTLGPYLPWSQSDGSATVAAKLVTAPSAPDAEKIKTP